MILRRLLLLSLVAFCWTLTGCDNLSGGKAIQPELTSKATLDRVVMHPDWLGADQVKAECAGKLACTRLYQLGDGEYHAYLTAVEPLDFNDFSATETLGHECWHGFGAKHK